MGRYYHENNALYNKVYTSLNYELRESDVIIKNDNVAYTMILMYLHNCALRWNIQDASIILCTCLNVGDL